MENVSFKNTASLLLDHWMEIAYAIDPQYKVVGDQVLLLNPTRNDEHQSFGFNRKTGQWKDFALNTREFQGAISSVYGHTPTVSKARCKQPKKPFSFRSPMKPSYPTNSPTAKPQAELKPVSSEGIAAIPGFIAWVQKNRGPVTHWIIKDIDGRTLSLRIRIDNPDGTKEVKPAHWNGHKWIFGGAFAQLFFMDWNTSLQIKKHKS